MIILGFDEEYLDDFPDYINVNWNGGENYLKTNNNNAVRLTIQILLTCISLKIFNTNIYIQKVSRYFDNDIYATL